MSVPKNKVISVTKGFMALADLKNQSPSNTNSQSVIVNVAPSAERKLVINIAHCVVCADTFRNVKIERLHDRVSFTS